MIHIAVCDDEKTMRMQIRTMAVDFFHRRKMEFIIEEFPDGRQLLERAWEMDILFLDIQMERMDGMETARILRSRGFKGFLIFITVLKEMVFQAFEVQAYDYLVKPVAREKFDRMMNRLVDAAWNAEGARLLIRRGTESSVIDFDEIIFCEIIDRKVYLHLRTGKVIDYYDRMERLESKLDDRFFRSHRSYLLNMQYLKSYQDKTAFLSDGGRGSYPVPVSRLRGRAFSEAVLHYMKERGV